MGDSNGKSRAEGEYSMTAGVPKRQGSGKYADLHVTYDGHWSNDKMNGCGKYMMEMSGVSMLPLNEYMLAGVFIGASGGTYDGEFVDDTFQGRGTYKWPDGSVYAGQWSHSKMHGKGEYVSYDGVRWEGEFYNGLFFNGKTHVAVR
jgi:hypothetical protein